MIDVTTGSLQIKGNKYYMVICFNQGGSQKQKWIATNLTTNGNKKRAEKMLNQEIKKYENYDDIEDTQILFSDYIENWLENHTLNNRIQPSTYKGYSFIVDKINEYFKIKNIFLIDLKVNDLQNYYSHLLKTGKSPNTVHKYHVVIRLALKNAYKKKMVTENIADLVDKPKKIKYKGDYYNREEIMKLLEVIKGNELELHIMLFIYYGFRRSEAIGLKWDAIDFEKREIRIEHKVTYKIEDKKLKLHFSDELKNDSSYRIMPMNEKIYKKLKELKDRNELSRKKLGEKYNEKYKEYVYVRNNGDIITPDYITKQFSKLLLDNNLRKIRLHDLRHSCATLLLSEGYNMKEIQEWLGHGDIGTTMNIYAHMEQKNKKRIINGISVALEGSNVG